MTECRDCGKYIWFWKVIGKPWYKIRCKECEIKHNELDKRIWEGLSFLYCKGIESRLQKQNSEEDEWWLKP